MGTEYIKNFNNVIIGIVETDAKGNQIIRNFPGRQILGYYKKDQDITTDFYGRILSRGNTTISLIYQK